MNTEQEIDAAIGAMSGGRVLDVATGYGSATRWLMADLQDYEAFVAIDAVEIASRPPRPDLDASIFEREDVTFQQMDAHQMAFEAASFDTVVMTYSLHHMAAPRRVLAECGRVLRPDGHFIMVEMMRDNLSPAQQTHMLMHHWWAAIDSALGVDHYETFARADLVAMVEALGLADVQLFDHAHEADPHDAEMHTFLRERAAEYLERAKDLPNYAALKAQADDLLARLESVGYQPATVLYAIGRK